MIGSDAFRAVLISVKYKGKIFSTPLRELIF
jgi:hypothetical protein